MTTPALRPPSPSSSRTPSWPTSSPPPPSGFGRPAVSSSSMRVSDCHGERAWATYLRALMEQAGLDEFGARIDPEQFDEHPIIRAANGWGAPETAI